MKTLIIAILGMILQLGLCLGEVTKAATFSLKSDSAKKTLTIPLKDVEFVETVEDKVNVYTLSSVIEIVAFPKRDFQKPDARETAGILKTLMEWHLNGRDEEKSKMELDELSKQAVDKKNPQQEFYQRVVSTAMMTASREIFCVVYTIRPRNGQDK